MLTSANTAANPIMASMRALLLCLIIPTLTLVACGGSYDDGTSSGEDGLTFLEPEAPEHCWGPVDWVEGSHLYVYSMDPEKLVWESVAPEQTVCLDIPRVQLCLYQGSEPGKNQAPPADMRAWEGNAPECAPGVE